MFTGLIEDVGKVARLQRKKGSVTLTVGTKLPLKTVAVGASIAVSGACLTVVSKSSRTLRFELSPETLKRTSFQMLETGSLVNLERSMRLSDRLGGHLVTGHVDGMAEVESVEERGEFTWLTFSVPASLKFFLVGKGSVAVDGISLTVNECSSRRFSVAIIPFTLRHTNLRARRVGDKVNIETDLIGKYVHKFMSLRHFDDKVLRP
jgi:riboflavin synthase